MVISLIVAVLDWALGASFIAGIGACRLVGFTGISWKDVAAGTVESVSNAPSVVPSPPGLLYRP